jgi:hypothetical protein
MSSFLKINRRFIICLIVSIVLHIIFGFVLYMNFRPSTKVTASDVGPPKDPGKIQSGSPADRQDFVITRPGDNTRDAKNAESGTGAEIHTVKPGESYWTVARKYNISMQKLIEFNGLSVNHVLKVGEKLRIPR